MINMCETDDGVVFDMSGLECDALRSYADGLIADPEHPFVELLRSQGLVVGDTPVPHLAAVLEGFAQATKVLTAWVVAPVGCRRVTFFVGPRSVAVVRCDDGGLYADEAWVGLAVRVVDVTSYPSLSGESWRLLATSQDVCEVLTGVEFAELYPDEVPLLADKDGEFWAAVASSSPEVLWEDVEDVLAE